MGELFKGSSLDLKGFLPVGYGLVYAHPVGVLRLHPNDSRHDGVTLKLDFQGSGVHAFSL